MVLRVTLEEFAEAVRRYAAGAEVFVANAANGVTLTARNPKDDVMVSSHSERPMTEICPMLEKAGLKVCEGEWQPDPGPSGTVYVAAVAYRSRETMPGLWVDCFPTVPTQMDVLKALYDEFVQTGDINGVSFDKFVQQVQPNVLILGPEELAAFASRKG